MRCEKCGHENGLGSNFCSSCGGELGQVTDPTTVTLQLDAIVTEGSDDEFIALADEPSVGVMVVRRGPNAGSRFLLDEEVTSAGRHPDSDIFLDDVTVSRRHVEIIRSGSEYLVRDVGSLNGTYVNHERVDEQILTSGDEVQIGKFKLVYLDRRD